MSTITQLICNKFGGIRQRNAVFSEDLITAQDIQNVELYYTGTNGGVGIRTAKGNISINDSLENKEKIINIFESVQGEQTYFFVHTEDSTQGKFYLYDMNYNNLILKKNGLSITGVSNGFDVRQGWSDLFFFTNGKEMFTIEIGAENEEGELEEVVDMLLKDRDNRDVVGLGAALFNNRLFIFNDNILWYSVTSNIYDFQQQNRNGQQQQVISNVLKILLQFTNIWGLLPFFMRTALNY